MNAVGRAFAVWASVVVSLLPRSVFAAPAVDPFDGPATPPIASSDAATPSAPAIDEVRLLDGGILRGRIVATVTGSHVVFVVQGTSEERTIAWSQIAEVVRGDAGTPVATPPPAPVATHAEIDESAGGPGRPYLYIDVVGGRQVELYRKLAEFTFSGTNISGGGEAFAPVCVAPCRKVIDGRDGTTFFVRGDAITRSRAFRLNDRGSAARLHVRPGRLGLFISGLILVSVGAGLLVSGAPLLRFDSLHKSGLGMTVFGAVAIPIAIPMIYYGSTRVSWDD